MISSEVVRSDEEHTRELLYNGEARCEIMSGHYSFPQTSTLKCTLIIHEYKVYHLPQPAHYGTITESTVYYSHILITRNVNGTVLVWPPAVFDTATRVPTNERGPTVFLCREGAFH